MRTQGYIKSYRSLLDWEWWDDHDVTRLWIYLLHAANWEDKKWQGIDIKRGQLLTSLHVLSVKTGLSVKVLRRALLTLKSTGELTSETTNKYTIITICKYSEFQSSEELEGQADGQANGQTTDKQRANEGQQHKNYKKERKKEDKNKIVPTTLSDEQIAHLTAKYSAAWVEYWQERLAVYLEGDKGKKWLGSGRDLSLAVQRWHNSREKKGDCWMESPSPAYYSPAQLTEMMQNGDL